MWNKIEESDHKMALGCRKVVCPIPLSLKMVRPVDLANTYRERLCRTAWNTATEEANRAPKINEKFSCYFHRVRSNIKILPKKCLTPDQVVILRLVGRCESLGFDAEVLDGTLLGRPIGSAKQTSTFHLSSGVKGTVE